ncbi:MAG TPA: hypothetical protein VH021_20485 [Trebonia sp.]|nr:hypothetical protein [Trebonia sp.]
MTQRELDPLDARALVDEPGSEVVAEKRRLGDNDGMARDDGSRALLRLVSTSHLDGARPSGTIQWVNLAAPVVIQAAAGAGHWAAGRRQRALAEWAGAAGFGLIAWGLGTEAAAAAEVQEDFQRMLSDLMPERGTQAPATAVTETPAARRIERIFRRFGFVFPVANVVLSVPWRLRHPRRLTGLAIATEAPAVVHSVLRAGRAVQRRRPRMAVGSALVAAGSVARLRAASAEPLR